MSKSIIILVVFCLMIASCSDHEDDSSDNSSANNAAVMMPALNKVGLISIQQLCQQQAQKKLALKFFASWCLGCQHEHQAVAKLADAMTTVGIAYKNDNDEAISWLATHNYQLSHIGYDRGGYIGSSYGIFGLPETVVISCQDNSDKITKVYHKRGILQMEDVAQIHNLIAN